MHGSVCMGFLLWRSADPGFARTEECWVRNGREPPMPGTSQLFPNSHVHTHTFLEQIYIFVFC